MIEHSHDGTYISLQKINDHIGPVNNVKTQFKFRRVNMENLLMSPAFHMFWGDKPWAVALA